MSRVLAHIRRFAVIVLGLFCAWAAASAFVHVLVLGGTMLDAGRPAEMVTGREVFTIVFGTFIIGRLSLWPALAAVLAAEFLGRRDWLFFSLAGAAVSLAALFLGGVYDAGLDRPEAVAAIAATGLVGGIAYWAVAGRSSGRWLERPADPTADPTEPGPSGS